MLPFLDLFTPIGRKSKRIHCTRSRAWSFNSGHVPVETSSVMSRLHRKAKLFINYRREDTAPYAGRLHDRLRAHFGDEHVFMDVHVIPVGDDFVETINRNVMSCDVAIVA